MPLAGREGHAWRAGDIVLKPADVPADELEWQAAVIGSIQSRAVRVAPPRRAADGAFVVDGWCATDYLTGAHEPARWPEVIRAGEALHAAIAGQSRPPLLDRRTDRWAVGDRVAWEELPDDEYSDLPFFARLAAAREPLDGPSQLIHGDLTGNVLFADGLPPAIIDFSAYWRPTAYASAIVVADALVWEGADASVLDAVGHVERFGQYLVRALIFRLLSEARPHDGDRYRPAVELALSLTL